MTLEAVGQRAAVELDLAVGDALRCAEGQAAGRPDLQRLVGVVDRDRGRRQVGRRAGDLQDGGRGVADRQRPAAHRPRQVQRAVAGRERAGVGDRYADRAGAGDVGVRGDGAQAADRAAGERDAVRIGQPDAGRVQLHRIGADRQRIGDRQGPGGVDLQRPGRAEEGHGRGAAGAIELQGVAGDAADPQKGRRGDGARYFQRAAGRGDRARAGGDVRRDRPLARENRGARDGEAAGIGQRAAVHLDRAGGGGLGGADGEAAGMLRSPASDWRC